VRRGVFDVFRRGVDNTIANWPLVLIRLGETLLFGVLTIAAALIAIVPILVSVGVEVSKISTTGDLENAFLALMTRWTLLGWVFVAISVLILLFIVVHSFVEAGSARVYIDGERAAGPAMQGPRSRFRAFTMDRWMAGARDGWWTLFWIYNLAWGAASLILLIPLLPTIAGMLLLRERQSAAIATGCVGLALTGLLLIVVGGITGIWVNRAVTEWAVHRFGARQALTAGWSAFRGDLGRHLLVFVAVIVVAMAGSSFFAGFSMVGAIFDVTSRSHNTMDFFAFPVRILGSLFNSAFSSIVSAWYLATFAALASE
jgi:hypothetical protein